MGFYNMHYKAFFYMFKKKPRKQESENTGKTQLTHLQKKKSEENSKKKKKK